MLEFVAIAGLGAIAQEIAHSYELRKRFVIERVRVLFRSKEYWLVTVAMVAISPFCCWVLIGSEEIGRQAQFYAGAAFPLILKKAISSFSKTNQITLGKIVTIQPR